MGTIGRRIAAVLVALVVLGSVLGVVGGQTAAHADNTCQVGSKVTTLQPISGSQRWALDDMATECFTNGVAYGWSFIFHSRFTTSKPPWSTCRGPRTRRRESSAS